MKTWKKVLIGVGILVVVIIGALSYGAWKIADNLMTSLEPDMQQYIKMSTEEQNQYVLQNMDKLILTLKEQDNGNDEHGYEVMKTDPVVRQAAMEWGRSVCAFVIVNSESVSANLTPSEKTKYIQEANDENERGKKFSDELDRALKDAGVKQ